MQPILLFIHQHLLLSAALLIVVILLIILEWAKLKKGATALTPSQLVQLINHQDAAIIDIRNHEAYLSGHIVNAISLPQPQLAEKNKFLEKYRGKPLVVVCATGQESQAAASSLLALGIKVQMLGGGMRAWRNADMPIVKG